MQRRRQHVRTVVVFHDVMEISRAPQRRSLTIVTQHDVRLVDHVSITLLHVSTRLALIRIRCVCHVRFVLRRTIREFLPPVFLLWLILSQLRISIDFLRFLNLFLVFLQLTRLLLIHKRALLVAQRRLGLRRQIIRRQEIRILRYQRIKVRHSIFPLPQLQVHRTSLIMHFRQVRIQIQRSVIVVQRPVVVAQLLPQQAAVIIGLAVTWTQINRFVVVAQRAAVIMPFVLQHAAVDVVACPFTAQVDSLRQVKQRLFIIVQQTVNQTSCTPVSCVLLLIVHRLRERCQRAQRVAAVHQNHTFLEMERGRPGLFPQQEIDVL